MSKKYFLGALVLGWLNSQSAQAQYAFTDTKLQPYTQDFNSLTGNAAMTGNHLTAPAEVYAQASFPGTIYTDFSPATIGANDGSNNTAYYYHFGPSSGAVASDRSFGGIAGTTFTANGIGYVGIRLKNSTTVTIKNLEVQYAMEQWYNSGRQDAAQVSVSYLIGSAVTSLLQTPTAWTTISALAVDAPSTATVIASRDGNSAANRRVRQTTLAVNLLPDQEIMLRWAYTLNTATNGNGLSIDDVVITPETNTYYSKRTGNLNDLTTWGQNTDGSGTSPTSFAAANQVFYVMSNNAVPAAPTATDATDRLSGTWSVSGDNSKIIVGTAAAPAAMQVANDKNVVGTIDVSPGSYFYNRQSANPKFKFGSLATTSTVEYSSGSTTHTVQAGQYGNLTIGGGTATTTRSANAKMLAGNTIIGGTLKLTPGSNLELGAYDLTLLSTNGITGASPTAYVVTDGAGRLRLQVPRTASSTAGTPILFPVGSTYTSYTPATLQQTTNTSDDIFEVRVADGVSSSYNASHAPTGNPVAQKNVMKTWLISKEVPTNATNVTMQLQWNTGETTTDFQPAQAHINHYTGGAWDINTSTTEWGATTVGSSYVALRTGITSFSPFSISSQTRGTLPVVLTSFTAQRTGAGVRCNWATASEVNSHSFNVERSSDGLVFRSLGSVAAAGTSTLSHSYSFLDAQPLATTSYYRLHQLDSDGQQAYSPVVAVAGTGLADLSTAAPNPTTGLLDVWAASDATQVDVINVLGANVQHQVLAAPAQRIPLDLRRLPAGIYYVRLATAQGPQVVRISKQ